MGFKSKYNIDNKKKKIDIKIENIDYNELTFKEALEKIREMAYKFF